MHARVEDLLAHRDGRTGERRVGGSLVTRLPGKDMIGMSARAVPHFFLVGDILADHGRIGRQRLLRVDDGRQLLVLDFDQGCAIVGGVAVGRQHHGDLLILKADFLIRQHGLHIAGNGRHPMQVDRLQIIRRQHRDDPRRRQRLALVDRVDARMRVGTAHDRAEQHSRQFDVIDIQALAANEARILLAQQRAAHTLKFLRAFAEFRGVAHASILRWSSPSQAAAGAAASFLAADCTAFTMF